MKVQQWVKSCLGKNRYASEEFARSVANKQQKDLRVYYCTLCAGYHLTKRV